MSFTGVDSLDASIGKVNQWLADVADAFGTDDRRFAYRVLRTWLHCLRDRLTVQVAAHFAAQLPELLRGVFYDGWNPSRVPVKYGRSEYVARFARGAGVHESDVAKAARLVTVTVRRHLSAGAVDDAFVVLPTGLRQFLQESADGAPA